jgi:hypothetical protein
VGADADRSADGIYGRSVTRSELTERLGKGAQAHTVLVLDACFSGQSGGGGALVPGLQPLVPTALASQGSPRGTHVLTATGSGEFSGSLRGTSRPAFSYLLLGALSGWGDGANDAPDGRVSLQEARDWTAGALNLTVQGRTQTPQLLGEDLRVGRAWRKDAPDLVAMTSPPAVPASGAASPSQPPRPPTAPSAVERPLPAPPEELLARSGVRFLPLDDSAELADIEVPQSLWKAVTGQNPSSFFHCGEDCPVENVGIDAALRFCNTLSAAEGRRPAYARTPAGWTRDPQANGYRLPTPEEWRRAAGPLSYAGSDLPNAVAWTRVNAEDLTHAGRGLRPAAGGWFDLSGNVAELLFDDRPAVCGGSWDEPAMNARVDACPGYPVNPPSPRVGLRLARCLTP